MITIQHIADDRYINRDREDGFCKDITKATRFRSVFQAMKFLAIRGEKDITSFDFLDDSTTSFACRRR